MVSYNPNNRYSIKEVITSNWMKDIDKIFIIGHNKLNEKELEISNKFRMTTKIFFIEKSSVFSQEIREQLKTKSFGKSDDSYFRDGTIPEKINLGIHFNNIFEIKGSFDPAYFMNKLYDFFLNELDSELTFSKHRLEFITNTWNDDEENEENEKNEYLVRLYQNLNNDNYFLNLNYISSSLKAFYNTVERVGNYLKVKYFE